MSKQCTPKTTPQKTTPRKKDDSLLKSAFQEAFPELLRFYFPEADAIFDIERGIEFLDKELGELFPERQ
jgi:hypothetical protein